MMVKKRKGFSLAEVLITMMIVGVVAAASIPTVTKNTNSKDKLWDWTDYPLGSIYYTGAHVLLDSDNSTSLPKISVDPTTFNDNYFKAAKTQLSESAKLVSENVFSPSSDTMVIFNNYQDFMVVDDKPVPVNDIQRAHINFYNTVNSRFSLASLYEYGGRLASDKTNLALGIGNLQYLMPEGIEQGLYNTSIGHYNSFVTRKSSHTTTLGRYALVEFEDIFAGKAHNVAIGNKSQVYNMFGTNNTAVGFRSLNGIEGSEEESIGSSNIAIGVEAIGTAGKYGDIINGKEYYSGNIGLGYRAGYSEVPDSDTGSGNSKRMHQLFLASETIDDAIPVVQALESKLWHNGKLFDANGGFSINDSEFNINADELIVNTADGKHTILKIRMIDDAGVMLPTFENDTTKEACTGSRTQDCYSFYTDLGYCTGEGTDDLYRLSIKPNDSRALADVCIAKFKSDGKKYGLVKVVPGGSFVNASNDKKSALKQWAENAGLNVKKPQPSYYSDWDIYLRHLDIGYSGGEMTGAHKPLHIQTVKASLNYLDAWKEGQGVLTSAIRAFVQNFKCYFQFFGSNCQSLEAAEDLTLVGLIKQVVDTAIQKLGVLVEALVNTVNSIIDTIFSDARLKNVSGVSTAGLKEINALKIKNYTYKADKNQTPHVGVIAQELQEVFPNSVIEGSDGYLRIKKEEMFFAMVNAIKELDKQDKNIKNKIPKTNKRIKTVVQKNKALVYKNEKLKAENEKLNAQLKLLEAGQ